MKKLSLLLVFVLALPIMVANAPKPETIDLPIVMYHQIFKCTKGKYCVSPTQLEEDFTAILAAEFTPVFMSEVIDWVDGKGKLPKKPIVITFDDGNYNNLHYGLPIAKKLGVKIMISPVTSFTQHTIDTNDAGNPNYSHITWAEMKQAVDTGMVEIGNHTHKMHRFKPRYGITKLSGETDDEYAQTFKADICKAQKLITESGVPVPRTFVYPFGKYTKQSRDLLIDMGFRAILTCNEHVSKVTRGDPSSLYALGRFNRDGGITTDELLKKITIH